MSKNSNRALILYQMNYNNWDSTFREKLSKSEEHYRNWFFTQAKEVSISDEIYNEFINNPIMLSGITNTLLEESYHTFKSDVPSDT